jgi:hypothetical protein
MAEVQVLPVHVTLNLQQSDPIVELRLNGIVLVRRDCLSIVVSRKKGEKRRFLLVCFDGAEKKKDARLPAETP